MKSNSNNLTKLYRFILFAAAYLYFICLTLVYRMPNLNDPISLNQRIAIISVFLILFVLSFFSQWLQQNLEQVTYLAAILVVAQLIYHNYLIGYELPTAVSLILIITAINLIFTASQINLYSNLILAIFVVSTLFVIEEAAVLQGTYFMIYLTAAGLSYFISYQRLKTKETLNETLQVQDLLINMVDFQIWHLKDEFTYGKVNQAFADFLGMSKAEIENKKIEDIHSTEIAQKIIECNKEAFRKKEKRITEKWIPNFNGKQRLLLITKNPKLNNTGKVEHLICSAKDITEQKIKEYKVNVLSYRDSLTHLHNRRFLEEEMERLDTERQLPISIIMGDVNNLKVINDDFGHKKGDELIVKVASILEKSVREEDILGRWGGDEFVILLPKTSSEEAQTIIDRINRECSKTVDDELTVSIALGLATKTTIDQKIKEVLIQADEAMFANKNSRR